MFYIYSIKLKKKSTCKDISIKRFKGLKTGAKVILFYLVTFIVQLYLFCVSLPTMF